MLLWLLQELGTGFWLDLRLQAEANMHVRCNLVLRDLGIIFECTL
jgi:hypothetical protein